MIVFWLLVGSAICFTVEVAAAVLKKKFTGRIPLTAVGLAFMAWAFVVWMHKALGVDLT